mgnify:CR=1 FL=1
MTNPRRLSFRFTAALKTLKNISWSSVTKDVVVEEGAAAQTCHGFQLMFTFDAAKNEYKDLVAAGIIDPTKVVRMALENAVSVAGVLLMVMGWLRLGAWVRYVPVSIVVGFTNGIAVLIGLSQIKDLLGLKIDKLPADFFTQLGVLSRHLDTFNPVALLMGSGGIFEVALDGKVVSAKSLAGFPGEWEVVDALTRALDGRKSGP